jgi:para-aminobenzoate synthetase/4-amino-4-deoxychorismate lyase
VSIRRFDLIEAMAFDPHVGIAELQRHLDRMRQSATALGFPFNHHEARNELQAATFRGGPSVVRLLLSPSGAMAIELRDRRPLPEQPVTVAVAPLPVPPDDPRLHHQTSDPVLEEARAAAGTFELLFRDAAGFLTQGSCTNLFVERAGTLLTPPLARGLLPGVLRGKLIDAGEARETDLIEADLANGMLLGSVLFGLVRGVLLSANSSAPDQGAGT